MRLPRLAFQRETGGFALRRRQGGVAQSAEAALGRDEAGARDGQIREHLAVLAAHHRAHRHLQHEIFAAGAVAPVAGAVRAALRLDVRAVLEVQQGVDLGGHLKHDVAAVPAVAAVRAAERFELLAVDGRAAVAAVACLQVQGCAINELGHGGFSRLSLGHGR